MVYYTYEFHFLTIQRHIRYMIEFDVFQTRLTTSNPEFAAAVQESIGEGREVIRPDGDVDLPKVGRLLSFKYFISIIQCGIYSNSDTCHSIHFKLKNNVCCILSSKVELLFCSVW